MSRYNTADSTLKYIGGKFEFRACPNPNCIKFNKPFVSILSAVGHFSSNSKKECARIKLFMETAKESGEKKDDNTRHTKRIKVDMLDKTKFSGAPPFFQQNFKPAAYRPLYTQISSRVPDLSIPLTPMVQEGDKVKIASNPSTKDGSVTTSVAIGNKSDNSDVVSYDVNDDGTGGPNQEENHDTKASSRPFFQNKNKNTHHHS